MQYFVQFYQGGVYTRYAQGTVQSYDLFSFGGALLGKTYDGVGSACFG